MKKSTIFNVLLLTILCFGTVHSQGFLREVSLQQQIEKSDLVVEGKVISKRSTWDDQHRLIYTVNTIEVYKVFKGTPVTTAEVITVGGTVGLKALIVHPSLSLRQGDIGVFTLSSSAAPISRAGKSDVKKYQPYGLSQGFYKYNLRENLAANPVKKKVGIADSFYNEIKSYANKKVIEVKSYDIKREMSKTGLAKSALPPGAITLNKSTVTAGTKEQLTITGTSFGSTQGKVWFRNSDDGGSTFISALDSEVISWSDTMIVVEVPSKAGTGTMFVEDSSAGQSPLSSTLTVSYAEINVVSDAGGNPFTAYNVRHVDANSSGGYTWEMQTDFLNETEPGVNTGYLAAFTRALNRWICETGINWTVSGSATTVNAAGVAADGTNLISFDKVDELSASALGTCFSWYSGCAIGAPPSTVSWYVEESDMIFDDGTNWFTGTGIPGGSQFDFESVALHELGHAHQLAHVIDPVEDGNNLDDVMHWNITNGESQKALTANNSTGANGIQTRSTTGPSVCSQTVMTDASCPLSIHDISLNEGITIFPNPASTSFTVNNSSGIPIEKAELLDVRGRLISIHNFAGGTREDNIDVSNASRGMYFLRIYAANTSITRKLILD